MTTGFTPEQVSAVLMRDGGMCALSGILDGCQGHATTANHRLNRGAGGSKLRNGLSNACAICDHCNGLIEADADAAEEARRRGVKLRTGDNPEVVRLWSPFFRQMVQPKDDRLELLGSPYEPREGVLS